MEQYLDRGNYIVFYLLMGLKALFTSIEVFSQYITAIEVKVGATTNVTSIEAIVSTCEYAELGNEFS